MSKKTLKSLDNLFINGRKNMQNTINLVIYSGYWPIAGNFGLNTNLLETNLINLSVVLSLLVYFGKGVCAG